MADGYGSGAWGSSRYGLGTFPPPPTPPLITPLSPRGGATGVAQLKPITLRLTDNVAVAIGTLMVGVNGVNWVVGGVAQGGVEMTLTPNGEHGYDVELTPPAPYADSSRQEVTVYVENDGGVSSSLIYSFNVGVGPRLLLVRNPMEGLLLAHFNRPMKIDTNFLSPANWGIVPVSVGAAPIEVTEIVANPTQPDVAHIRYSGGGSVYFLTILGITAPDGTPLERGYANIEFHITYGSEESPTVRLFDSIFGPLGISQRSRKRRHIDDFVANRSIALALDEQFRLRFQQLDNTVGRDGRNGKLRTT